MASSFLLALADLRTRLDWALRQALTWSPPAFEEAETKDEPVTDDEARWTEVYGLAPARDRMTEVRWRRNLAVVQLLDRAAGHPALAAVLASPGPLRALDVGAKNFDYVDGLAAVLGRVPGLRSARAGLEVTGLELDAHRRYTDLRTRRAWADHYASHVPGARYRAGDLLDEAGSYQILTWFFPFVTEFPLRRWGLPRRYFRPQDLFDHALGLLAPGGVLVVVNLNADEARIQRDLGARSRAPSFEAFDLGVVPGAFGPRAADHHLWLYRRS